MGPFRCLALFAALSALLIGSAHGAPAPKMNFEEGRELALELNKGAKELYREVENPDKLAAVSDPPLMIRPEDKCDPDSLVSDQEPCLSRVTLALKNYSRIFGEHGLFREENTKCSKWRANATAMAEVSRKLLLALKEPDEVPEPLIFENWMSEGFLCRDSVDRLYSFSIVTARVFNFLFHHTCDRGTKNLL